MTINFLYHIYIYTLISYYLFSTILLLLSFKSLIKISSNLLIMFAVIVIMCILLKLEVLYLFPLTQSLDTKKLIIILVFNFFIFMIYKKTMIYLLVFSKNTFKFKHMFMFKKHAEFACNMKNMIISLVLSIKKVLRSRKWTRRVLTEGFFHKKTSINLTTKYDKLFV